MTWKSISKSESNMTIFSKDNGIKNNNTKIYILFIKLGMFVSYKVIRCWYFISLTGSGGSGFGGFGEGGLFEMIIFCKYILL